MHAKTETQGELTQWQAEIGVVQLQAKECQRQMAASEEIEEMDFAGGQVMDSQGQRVGTSGEWFPSLWVFLIGLQ